MTNKDFFAACCSSEGDLFKKAFAAVPVGALDHRPEPKARSARELIGHLIGHEQDLIELLDDGIIHHRNVVAFDTLDEAIEMYDSAHAGLIDRLRSTDEDTWNKQAQFWAGDHLVGEMPTSQLAWTFLFDSIHHRGQLTTYIRPNGGKVPALYGPSADDPGH